MGETKKTHYGLLASRGWKAHLGTWEKYVDALTRAGVDPSELETGFSDEPDEWDPLTERAIEILVRRHQGLRLRAAVRAVNYVRFEPPRTEGDRDPTPEDIVELAELALHATRQLGTPPPESMGLHRVPGIASNPDDSAAPRKPDNRSAVAPPSVPPKVANNLKPKFQAAKTVGRRKTDGDSHKPPR